MTQSPWLLFIDNNPVTPFINAFFSEKNLAIRQTTDHSALENLSPVPEAIIMNWQIIQPHLHMLQRLKQTHPIPLMITHDVFEEEICIKALEAGADTLIIQPFEPRELQAHMTAIKRRINNPAAAKMYWHFADWFLCTSSRRLFNPDNEEVLLSAGEYELLMIFIHHAGQILSREKLMLMTRQIEIDALDRRMDVQISRLRQKIEADVKHPVFIKTVRNGGYQFLPKVTQRYAHIGFNT